MFSSQCLIKEFALDSIKPLASFLVICLVFRIDKDRNEYRKPFFLTLLDPVN